MSLAVVFAAALLCSAPGVARAQQSDWTPPGIELLAAHASFHTDFTFDKSMLGMAGNFTSDEQVRQAVEKLRSVSVHTYNIRRPAFTIRPRSTPCVLNTPRVAGIIW